MPSALGSVIAFSRGGPHPRGIRGEGDWHLSLVISIVCWNFHQTTHSRMSIAKPNAATQKITLIRKKKNSTARPVGGQSTSGRRV